MEKFDIKIVINRKKYINGHLDNPLEKKNNLIMDS